MLERATACLKAGARDSLKCAQHAKAQAPRTASHRRLHSTFWTHGAGDIELDINLFGIGAGGGAGVGAGWGASTPPELACRHDDIHSAGPAGGQRRKEPRGVIAASSSTSTSHGAEVPFLDFLYPPHALAWLQRSNGQPWERWERRNAKRLPDGFVRASRGYSSRSHARSAEATRQEHSVPDDTSSSASSDRSNLNSNDHGIGSGEVLDSVENEPSQHNAAAVRFEPVQNDPEGEPSSTRTVRSHDAMQMVRELAPSASAVDETGEDVMEDDEEPSDTLTAISPGELSEEQTRDLDHVANPLEALRTIMTTRRKLQTVQNIGRAWLLYTSLSETAKADPQLMHELLLWFARINEETAQAHAISLFWSLPLESRTLADYQAALSAFLKRKTYDAVAGVHQEALRNIPNGHQITKDLFMHAVQKGNWQLALAVKEDHDSAFEGDGPVEARQKALFWINVTEIPDLTQKAAGLARKCQWFKRRSKSDADKFTAFSASISEEAFRQAMLTSPSNVKPSQVQEQSAIQRLLVVLLDSIRQWSSNAPRLYEEFLVKLLDLNQSEKEYQQVHDIVSYIYGHYREMPDFRPSEEVFQRLLSRVLPYAIDKHRSVFAKRNITIEVILEDWQKHHTVLSHWAVTRLMQYYARQGMPELLNQQYMYLKRHYPDYEDQKSVLWTLIYVHARRAEPEKAREAFDHVSTIASLNGTVPGVKCWNILIHAQARADDLAAGLDTLKSMMAGATLLPDHTTIHPLLEMLARRGDTDGIADLLKQYDSVTGALHQTSFVGSRMRALINNGDVSAAEQILIKAVKQVRARELLGSLTICFNIMLSAYAGRRDIEATMRTYRWMKAEKIRLDRYTYTCLMLALIHFRQTSAAYTIMTKVMRRDGFEPTAAHYALVMTGLVKQNLYDRAIWVHQKMLSKNIRPSLATRRNYMKALAMQQRAKGDAYDSNGEPAPLIEVIKDLRDALVEYDGSEIAGKDPVFGRDPTSGENDVLQHFVPVLFAHGKHRCLEAVNELFRMYQDEATKLGKPHDAVPMQILVAMMNALFQAGEYDQVETYWRIAKDNADRIAAHIAVPEYQRLEPNTAQSATAIAANPDHESDATKSEVDRAAIGFEASKRASTQRTQTLLPASLPSMAPPPSSGRRKYILTRPLRYYLRALAAQNRIADVLTTFTALIRQGYAFDTITWNRLIEYLCTASPPLAMLAFTLTERYLILNFPGWTPRYMTRRSPRESAVYEGLQFMRGRYLSYDALTPQYRTMVFLTAALLKLRRMEATGSRTTGEIGRFVGTVRQIEAVAPKTFDAVNSMPQVQHDRLQHQLLRSDEANEL